MIDDIACTSSDHWKYEWYEFLSLVEIIFLWYWEYVNFFPIYTSLSTPFNSILVFNVLCKQNNFKHVFDLISYIQRNK